MGRSAYVTAKLFGRPPEARDRTARVRVACLVALAVTALCSAVAHAQGRDPAREPDFVETVRTAWGPYFVAFEENANRASVANDPHLVSRYRIVDADGREWGVMEVQRFVAIAFHDVDGDALVDLVFQGNSGGVSGCCDFLEVWSWAGGVPNVMFSLWGGRGVGDGYQLLVGAAGEPIPIRTKQFLYVGDVPNCCLPSVPRTFAWNGRSFLDVSHIAIPKVVAEALDEHRAVVRSLSASPDASRDFHVDAAAIGAYASAVLLGPESAEAELRALRELLPAETFTRLTTLVHEIEGAIESWIYGLDD